MKKHMSGWKVFFIVAGVLCLIGAAGSLLMVRFASVVACAAAALTMFMTASVCAWMDDLLEAVNQSRPAAQMRRRRPVRQAEETEEETEEDEPDTIGRLYRRARDSE